MRRKKDSNIIDLGQYRRKQEIEKKKNKRKMDKLMKKKQVLSSARIKMILTFGAIFLIGFLLAFLTILFTK